MNQPSSGDVQAWRKSANVKLGRVFLKFSSAWLNYSARLKFEAHSLVETRSNVCFRPKADILAV